MPVMQSERSIAIAQSLVRELKTQKRLAKYVGVTQPSVHRWTRYGLTELREAFLREKFPELRTWKDYPAEYRHEGR